MKTSSFRHRSFLRIATLVACTVIGRTALAQQQTLGERPSLPDAVDLQKQRTPTFDNDADAPPPLRGPQSPETPAPVQPVQTANGQYAVHAGMTNALLFDDNIYARSNSKIGDRIVIVRPEIGVDYRSEKYLASFGAGFENRNYQTNYREDNLNWNANYASTFAPRGDIQIQTRLGAAQSHEQRGTADSQFFAFDNPVSYHQYDAAAAFNKRFDGWWSSLGGARTWINYQTPTILGTPIDQSYRTGAISVGTLRVGKVVAPLTSAFIEVSGNRRDFDLDSFDSQGFRVVGGLLFEPGSGARIKGEAFAGYLQQDYTGPTFVNFSTFTYGGALAFRIDPRTIAVVDGRREAKESALAGGVSVLESAANARIDYQLTEKFTIGAGIGYLNQYYAGVDRSDSTYGPLLSAKYFLTPNVTFGIDYRYIGFASDTVGVSNYARNTVLLSVSGRL
jgi:hypothetical protein